MIFSMKIFVYWLSQVFVRTYVTQDGLDRFTWKFQYKVLICSWVFSGSFITATFNKIYIEPQEHSFMTLLANRWNLDAMQWTLDT